MNSSALPAPAPTAEQIDTLLADWRARGLPQQEPVRYHLAAALARRLAALPAGETRQRLLGRLAPLLAALADHAGRCDGPPPAPPAALAALTALTRRLSDAAADPPVAPGHGSGHAGASTPAAAPELKALRQHRRTWSRLAVARRVQQSQAQAPGQAGPLHSQALVLRALALMQDLSPDYLARFVAHADSLLWLEDTHGAPVLPARDVLGPAPAERPARKTRQRSG